MSKINVTYNTERVTKNKIVHSQGCNCISFINVGRNAATVLEDIPLNSVTIAHHFNNDNIDEIITQDFPIKFAGALNTLVIVVRTFKVRQ